MRLSGGQALMVRVVISKELRGLCQPGLALSSQISGGASRQLASQVGGGVQGPKLCFSQVHYNGNNLLFFVCFQVKTY